MHARCWRSTRCSAGIRATLDELGVAGDTYVVFTSDNGYHLGHYRLMQGKRTAYEPDIRVPLVIAGPDVPAGSASAVMASNVDLAPTFLDWAGAATPGHDGRSLERVLRGHDPGRWRRAVLVEHHEERRTPGGRRFGRGAGDEHAGDPDAQGRRMGEPGTYDAVRTADHLYVEHRDGSRELYDLRSDRYELKNVAAAMTARERRRWRGRLRRLVGCVAESCRQAERLR